MKLGESESRLKKLVNKFRKQTIEDQGLSPPKSVSSAPSLLDADERQVRKSARLNPGLFSNDESGSHFSPIKPRKFTSIYESDNDDELEELEKMSNASLGIGSVDSENICGQSPPVLTSSPPLISEIDTNSWDSAGCESGIVLRDSAERDDSSRNADFLDDGQSTQDSTSDGDASTPVERRDGFPVDFSALHAEYTKKQQGGAFQPVHSACSPTFIGEKRRWGSSALSVDCLPDDTSNSPSPVASRTRSALAQQDRTDEELTRAVLTAKRSRVKVLFHDPTPRRSAVIPVPPHNTPTPTFVTGILSESPPNNPSLKRGRHCKGNERPSLNFDKMREQMMSGSSKQETDSENVPFGRDTVHSVSSPDFAAHYAE